MLLLLMLLLLKEKQRKQEKKKISGGSIASGPFYYRQRRQIFVHGSLDCRRYPTSAPVRLYRHTQVEVTSAWPSALVLKDGVCTVVAPC